MDFQSIIMRQWHPGSTGCLKPCTRKSYTATVRNDILFPSAGGKDEERVFLFCFNRIISPFTHFRGFRHYFQRGINCITNYFVSKAMNYITNYFSKNVMLLQMVIAFF